jgi:quinol monooxygenase YgiN
MITVIGTHEVKDAKTWKVGFDADETNRANFGVKVNGVYASVENPNMITISMQFPNKEVLDGMMNNPEMQKTMAEAGVIGEPEFKVLSEI